MLRGCDLAIERGFEERTALFRAAGTCRSMEQAVRTEGKTAAGRGALRDMIKGRQHGNHTSGRYVKNCAIAVRPIPKISQTEKLGI